MRSFFFFSSRRRHTRYIGDWSSDVCSSDLTSMPAGPTTPSGQPTRLPPTVTTSNETGTRSEERRVGKECRCRWGPVQVKKKEGKKTTMKKSTELNVYEQRAMERSGRAYRLH